MDKAFGKLRSELKMLSSYKNTILWYCSDNGGLPDVGTTGGRGHKADIYEGGLRVPAILEWPAKIKEPGVTPIPASTSDIFPTLLEITGVQVDTSRPFDGISLVPLLNSEMNNRPKPIGFWHYPAPGIRTPSAEWMAELLEAQKSGDITGDSSRLRLDDYQIRSRYSLDTMKGHSAWLDYPWKLHRISDGSGNILWELYRLDEDPQESENLIKKEEVKASKMKTALEEWQKSVVRSMNGEDY